MTTSHPDQIGCYTVHGKTHFHSVKRTELDRAGVQMARTLRSFAFKPGSYVLTVSVVQEVVQFAPFGNEVLEGLKMMGHDAAAVFKGRTVWARPDAYDAVKAMPGVAARRVVLVGPALALECAKGGLHIDGREWDVTVEGEELVLSSRQYRIDPVSGLKTGLPGALTDTPCACGSPDPHVRLTGGI